MKELSKTLTATVLALSLLAGAQTLVFADDTSSQEASQTDALIVSSESGSEPEMPAESSADETTTPTEATTGTTTTGNGAVNHSPNTGASTAPFAVALLAAACVPIILKTRKK